MAVATAGPVPPNRADLPPHHTGLAVDLVMATGGGGKSLVKILKRMLLPVMLLTMLSRSGKAKEP